MNVYNNNLFQKSLRLEVRTKDNIFVSLDMVTQFKVKESGASTCAFTLDNPIQQMNSHIENRIV